MSSQPRLLIVDDEIQIRRFLRISLGANGFEVIEAGRGDEAIRKCASEKPDLVVLDLGLPDTDGIGIISRIREWSQVPIIVLSVRADERDKVAALDHGADDYVTKPFGVAELMARIRACLRVRQRQERAADAVIRAGSLAIDLANRRVTVDGADVKLTRKEFEILALLARNGGRIATHQQILREVWAPEHENNTHYLRIYIGHLRQKLGDNPTSPRFIENELGVGYRLLVTESDSPQD